MEVSLSLGPAVNHEHKPTQPTRAKNNLIGLRVGFGIWVITGVIGLFLYKALGIAMLLVAIFVCLVSFYCRGRRRRRRRKNKASVGSCEDKGIAIQMEPANPPPIDNGSAIQMEPTAQPNIASNADPPPIDNGIAIQMEPADPPPIDNGSAIQMEPTAQPNIASNAHRPPIDNGIAIQTEPTAQPNIASNADPPPIDNGIAIQAEPTAQPNIASNAQLSPGSANPLLAGPMKFTYEELVTATNGFSTANFLGQGGFGDVHKGVLPSGKQVAVKQLKAGSMQGEREFKAEVEIISRVHHKHLVSLVGYCISGTQMMLVYEYVPNNTLEFHLHENSEPTMTWETRMKIAKGSAKGLAYLHEDCKPRIIHRDIKAANILLHDNFEAEVADFGLAKFFPDDDTHVSTEVKGTPGYLDLEYFYNKELTDKSDVFSFGVVLLELITGRRPIYETQPSKKENLVVWARPLLKQALEGGNFDTLVDPRLQGYNSSEMAQMVACADACVLQSGVLRPRMSQIFQALEGNIHSFG